MQALSNIDTQEELILFWFRRDIRLDDNHGLYEALNQGKAVLALFIFDDDILSKLENKSDARVEFILQTLKALNDKLLLVGSSLLVLKGNPFEIHSSLVKQLNIHGLYANRDYEPYALERDKQIFELYQSEGKSFKAFKDHVIFDRNEVVKDNGEPYTVFTPYMKRWKLRYEQHPSQAFLSENSIKNFAQHKAFYFPSLEDLGFLPSETPIPSQRIPTELISNYHNTRDIPSIEGTSKLGVHLRFGTLSIRKLVEKAILLNEKWLNELIWRDFYQMILYHFPHSARNSFKPAYDQIEWETDMNSFKKWCLGQTGYPIVDAGMRELNASGFMHNRVRMITASFLTKHLLIDWRLGERYFASKLLDFDLASNVGGWQWAASSGCDAAPYFRVFNPSLQQEKFDKEFKYIGKWVPEWNSTLYPKPIVDHKVARERVLNRFSQALKK